MIDFFIGFVFAWSVIDGDTLKVSVHVWPNVAAIDEHVRLAGVDAPEIHRPAPDCERALGAKATEYVRGRMAQAKRIVLRAGTNPSERGFATRDSFGRILGDVLVDGVSLSDAGLAAGVYRPYADRLAGKAWC